MARRSSRVKLNRAALHGVALAVADGFLEVGKEIVVTADPPDATPFGAGLVTRGGTLVYVGADKVGGWGIDGKQPKKPRAFAVKGTSGIHGVVGFGFPARFQEFGTVHHGAQPFFTPAVDRVIPRITSIIRKAASYRLKRLGRI